MFICLRLGGFSHLRMVNNVSASSLFMLIARYCVLNIFKIIVSWSFIDTSYCRFFFSPCRKDFFPLILISSFILVALSGYFILLLIFLLSEMCFILVCRFWEKEKVRLDYRPVHLYTLDDEIEPFPPKARVYWCIGSKNAPPPRYKWMHYMYHVCRQKREHFGNDCALTEFEIDHYTYITRVLFDLVLQRMRVSFLFVNRN